MSSAPVPYIERIKEKYAQLGYPGYNWVVSETPPPWQPLSKPLSACRLGLIASGGIYVSGQVAFHYKDDTTYRLIPTDVQSANLRTTHFAYDLIDSRRDPNVVFPIDPLRQLVKEGVIGELAEHALTFMGGIYSSRRVCDELAPQLKDCLLAQQIDVLLLVPV
ncbi:MAG: glycine/sarcosine/betaine reductase selenoprotein B family protein [bacterium]|nr:glycine/sarcosine/betaine reductase selenoprotein B family protein [bacterium]